MPLTPGSRLGPYEIAGPLGAGGMGEVYRARDPRLDRDVAIKVLPEPLRARPGFQARFEREAKAVAALSHPNIVAIHDFGSSEGVFYAVSELLEGQTLRDRLAEGPVPPRKAVDWGAQVARGLSAAHDRGIVHRDLKPENIFITRDGHAKILDFGLAREAAPSGEEGITHAPTLGPGTEPGTVLGTVGYMSPEQVRGLKVDARTDLFAFGAVLYEMLAGRRAFQADTAADTMTAILREDPPELAEPGRAVPPALERVIRHCLEKDPADRFQSARDLIFSLESVTSAPASGEAAAIAQAPASAARRRRGGTLAAGLVVVGALAGVAAGFFLGRRPPSPPPTFRYLTYSGRDGEPSVSPDSRFIAYTSVRGGRSEIWIKQQPGGDEVALTTGPDSQPRFSPDGSLVLFTRREGGHPALYKVAVVGGEPRKLVDAGRDGDWSPDGRQVAFLRERKESDHDVTALDLVDASGQNARTILGLEGFQIRNPRWSPDGRLVAVVRRGAENAPNSIVLVRADGGGSRVLEPPPPAGDLSSVAWSGDGRSLIYAQAQSLVSGGIAGGSARILRQDVSSGRSEVILWIPASVSALEIAGPGRLLLGTSTARQNLGAATLGGGGPAAGGRWLTRGASIDRQPAFSPDGAWVLFSSNRSGNLDLYRMSIQDGTTRRVTEDAANDWDPAFTPDGAGIVWSSSRSGHFEIWACAADGTGARPLTDDGVDAENPTMTPDGTWVIYNSTNPSHSGIWKIHPDGSGAALLVPGTWSTPDVSHDGAYVAFRTGSEPRTLRVARVADGRLDPLSIALPGGPGAGRPRWLPDGRLAFTGYDAAGAPGIFVQDFVPGRNTDATRRPLAGFDRSTAMESFGISPDGRTLVYATIDGIDSLMLAEGVPGVEPRARPGR